MTELELEPKTENKEATEKSHVLMLINDDKNSFTWVIRCLVLVCGHSKNQAEQCAYITHTKGKCDIKHGDIEVLKKYKDTLSGLGLSVRIIKK